MSANRPHEAGVEGLRGCAALSVLYTHFLSQTDIDPYYSIGPDWQIFEAAQGAVLLFFILSGYVIGLTNDGPFTASRWAGYLWRRVVRLVPICWIAVALSALVRPGAPWRTVVGNFLFLQNDLPYGHWSLPVLRANNNIWTLNYEALYYLIFVACWLRPRAWKIWALVAFILSIVLWRLPGGWAPLLSCYAMGWLFWLIGYGLSQLKSDSRPSPAPLPWVSVLFFWLVTWQQKPFWMLCHRFDLLPRASGTWINYSFIDIIPASIVLMLAASGRRPRYTGLLCSISAVIPLAFLLWTPVRGRFNWWPPDHYTVFSLIACVLWRWRPDGERVWGKFAFIGSISYALYILQRPAQWFIRDAQWLPSGSFGSFALRLFLATVITFAVAWVTEKKLQPWVRAQLIAKRRAASPSQAQAA